MSKTPQSIVFIALFVSILLFQNCGPQSSLEMQNDSSGGGFTYMSDINSLSPQPVQPIAPLPPPPDVFATSCEVRNYSQWLDCLAKAKSPQGRDGLTIYVRANLTLVPGQRLFLKDHQNLQIIGEIGDKPGAVITESVARASSNQAIDQHLFVLGSGNRNVTIKGLNFKDVNNAAIVAQNRKSCRLGGHPTLANRHRVERCAPLVFLGGKSTELVSQQIYFQQNTITSSKAYLMQLGSLQDFIIEENRFSGGSYIGVGLLRGENRTVGLFRKNNFESAGTAGLSLSNAEGLVVVDNDFINNYKDPQYKDSDGQLHRGGQLEIIDPVGTQLKNVTIEDNTFITNSKGTVRSGVGIEVRGSSTGLIEDIKIIGNTFQDIPLAAIRFTRNSDSRHRSIVIQGNTIKNAYVDYDSKVRPVLASAIWLGPLHFTWPGLVLDNNNITAAPNTRTLSASFDGSEKTCGRRGNNASCSVHVKFKAGAIFSDTIITIKRNGVVVHRFAKGQNTGSVMVSGITTGGAVISLHESERDSAPLAAYHAAARVD